MRPWSCARRKTGGVQPFIHHPAPNGLAGFVLANGSMSSKQSGEGEIRKAIVGPPGRGTFRVMDAPRAAIFPLEVKG